jgi:hypothetical protein
MQLTTLLIGTKQIRQQLPEFKLMETKAAGCFAEKIAKLSR